MARTLARRAKRTASWADIDRFDREFGPVVVLRDGTKRRLFDWPGDSDTVVAQLESERKIRQDQPIADRDDEARPAAGSDL